MQVFAGDLPAPSVVLQSEPLPATVRTVEPARGNGLLAVMSKVRGGFDPAVATIVRAMSDDELTTFWATTTKPNCCGSTGKRLMALFPGGWQELKKRAAELPDA